MPLLLAGIVIGIVLAILYSSSTSSSGLRIFDHGETYIVIDAGTVRVRRGFVPDHTMSALADTLRDAGVASGHITMTKDNHISISWHIPPALHQTIRNILLLDRNPATSSGNCGAAA
jgi:hypothetical protein